MQVTNDVLSGESQVNIVAFLSNIFKLQLCGSKYGAHDTAAAWYRSVAAAVTGHAEI